MERREAFENLLDHAKRGGLGAHRELGFGPRDPMCLYQHMHHRMIRREEKPGGHVLVPPGLEIHKIGLTTREGVVLANRHALETSYRLTLDETDAKGGAKLREFPEILERILSGEKVEFRDGVIDVNADFALLVEEELRAAQEQKRLAQQTQANAQTCFVDLPQLRYDCMYHQQRQASRAGFVTTAATNTGQPQRLPFQPLHYALYGNPVYNIR